MAVANLTMTKRGKLTLLGVLVFTVLLLLVVNLFRGSSKSQQTGTSLSGVPLQGVTTEADYRLIPVLDAGSNDPKQVYLNTSVTPALFFATWDTQSAKEVQAVQDKLDKIGTHKPLVLVSTFTKSTDQQKAITEIKSFQKRYNGSLPITVQVGPPAEFVKQVPSLVYTDEKGTHVITDEAKILDELDTILAIPTSQPTTMQPTKK